MELDPTQRFSSRVEDYIRYRPSYPQDAIAWLRLTPGAAVADIGSGTGILSQLLLDAGCEVFGVEPNAGMRAAAERLLAREARFHSVDGRAEATTLGVASVHLVTAGQAFHWFEPAAARAEFARILRPGGWVVLIWNERLATPGLLSEYEDMLQRYSGDYAQVDHRRIDGPALDGFFGHSTWTAASFPNYQDFDWDGLRGRLLSSSYAPLPESENFAPMMAELRAMFKRYQQGGRVRVHYETKAYAGRL